MKILAARFELAHKKLLKLSSLPFGLHARNKFGGSEGIQTLTRSLQNSYAVNYITNPRIKFGVEDGILTRTSHVLTKHLHLKALRVSFHSATSTEKIVGADGEIRTHINEFLRLAPLPFRPRRRKIA